MVQQVAARPCRAWCLRAAASVLAAVVSAPALAQSPADGAPSEAARRQALGPFRMILQDADQPRKPAPKKVPRAVPASPAPASARGVAEAPAAHAVTQAPAAPAVPEEKTSKSEIAAAPVPAPAAPPDAVARAPLPQQVAPQPVALVVVKQDQPVLSAALRREQPEGIVKVGFAVKPDGSTADVQVLSSTNHRLNAASVAAVAGWRFQPIGETRPTEVELVFQHDTE